MNYVRHIALHFPNCVQRDSSRNGNINLLYDNGNIYVHVIKKRDNLLLVSNLFVSSSTTQKNTNNHQPPLYCFMDRLSKA